MNRFFKTTLFVVAVLLLAWLLPYFYHYSTTKKTSYPFIHYSSLLGDFLIQSKEQGSQLSYYDRKGNLYNERQVDSLMPTFFYRQLITESRLPDTLLGVPVNAGLLQQTGFFFRSSPRDLNTRKIALYPLLESRSKRVDLNMPEDVCRFTGQEIQFVDMATNTINETKSTLFQKVFMQKGVEFPIAVIGGNPTSRKEYDEGYFFTDATNTLFHLKQMQGRPYLKRIEAHLPAIAKYIFVTEHPDRKSFAYIATSDGGFYVLTAPDYRLVKTGLPPIYPDKENIFIMGNMFNWNVKISSATSIINYALNAVDYTLIDSCTTVVKTTHPTHAAQYLFPFELTFSSPLNTYFCPTISSYSFKALFFNLLLASIFVFVRRKQSRTRLFVAAIGIVGLGLFAWIPLLVYSNTSSRR